ncbi:MAG: T9SS type A sorting domain-containing protein [Bacteroidota bacterium]
MKFPIYLQTLLVLIVSIALTSNALACDYASLVLDDVHNAGNGKYDITMTFTAGAGFSGFGYGAQQNTWTFAFYMSGGATLASYPATITSPNTGAVFSAFTVQNDTVLAYHNPYEWWACIAGNCGPVQPIAYTITVQTLGLPTEITLLGMEGAGNPAAGCMDADMTVSTACHPIAVDAGTEATAYLGYAPAECVDLTATAIGGNGSYSYSWDTGENSQTISACPQTNTHYFVTVTDVVSGCTSIDYVPVNLVDIRCGNNNDKVLMCKNGQTRCVRQDRVQNRLNKGWILGPCGSSKSPIIDDELDVVADLELQVGPNPFHEYTTLRVTAPTDEEMSLKIYNLNGALVKVVHDGGVALGTTAFELRADGLAPGTYIARLATQSGDLVMKKLLIQ